MSQIVLIRHAEPALQGVILGAADVPLSPRGRTQARALSQALATPPRAIYVSPLRRALETAAYLLDPWRPCAVFDGLREISYGAWDGLSWEQIRARDPVLAERKLADWFGVNLPRGERWSEFEERVEAALGLILAGPLPAAVVAHEAVNAILARQLGAGAEIAFHQNYCETLRYDIQDNCSDV